MTMPAAPAEGEAMFEVVKQVNFAQLESEVRTALSDPDGFDCHLVGVRSDVPISPTNPAYLYVTPDSVDPETVNTAIDAHTPQPDENMPEPVLPAEG